MNKKFITQVIAAALLFVSLPALAANADHEVSIDFFYTSLAPQGEWLDVDDYGYCWHPTEVNDGWQPYTVGHWVYTDAGWTWASDEPFGWIVFHYGRWTYLTNIGWCWVPDTQWAPAWVSFRRSDEYIGWAPLPPEAQFEANVGFSEWVDSYYEIGPDYYSFVPLARFSAPLVRSVILRPERNLDFYEVTTNVTDIHVQENNVIVGGLNYEAISARSDVPITRLRLDRQINLDPGFEERRNYRSRIEGDRFLIPAPRISVAANAQPPRNFRQISAAKVDRGWDRTADPKKAEVLRARVKREAAPPASLPPEPKFERSLQARSARGLPQDTPPQRQGRPAEAGNGSLNPRTSSTPPSVSRNIDPTPRAVPAEPPSRALQTQDGNPLHRRTDPRSEQGNEPKAQTRPEPSLTPPSVSRSADPIPRAVPVEPPSRTLQSQDGNPLHRPIDPRSEQGNEHKPQTIPEPSLTPPSVSRRVDPTPRAVPAVPPSRTLQPHDGNPLHRPVDPRSEPKIERKAQPAPEAPTRPSVSPKRVDPVPQPPIVEREARRPRPQEDKPLPPPSAARQEVETHRKGSSRPDEVLAPSPRAPQPTPPVSAPARNSDERRVAPSPGRPEAVPSKDQPEDPRKKRHKKPGGEDPAPQL